MLDNVYRSITICIQLSRAKVICKMHKVLCLLKTVVHMYKKNVCTAVLRKVKAVIKKVQGKPSDKELCKEKSVLLGVINEMCIRDRG